MGSILSFWSRYASMINWPTMRSAPCLNFLKCVVRIALSRRTTFITFFREVSESLYSSAGSLIGFEKFNKILSIVHTSWQKSLRRNNGPTTNQDNKYATFQREPNRFAKIMKVISAYLHGNLTANMMSTAKDEGTNTFTMWFTFLSTVFTFKSKLFRLMSINK